MRLTLQARPWRSLATVAVSILLVLLTTPAWASEPTGSESPQSRPDFRFSTPSSTLGVRAGWTFNRAGSDIYEFITDDLTVEKSDFNAPTFALDFAWRIAERVDAVVGMEFSGRSKRSEFRDYVDQDDLPIVQETRLTQVPLTLSLKLYLGSRGRSVGQYAWVPASVVPYVGGGGGFVYYRLEQEGDFVDFMDLAIFRDYFESSGWTPSAHAFAGVDIKMSPGLGLVLEGRYQWASADLRDSYLGFEPIDLTGLRVLAGVNWKF